jgi:aldehyde:ferredoxin oxidoreductase
MADIYGWTGKIARVDLTGGAVSAIDTREYVPKFVGGRGVAHRIAWEEIPKGVRAFDPENRLMIMVGPLTGTGAPTSGRTEVAGIAAQSIPEMYSWSGVGGWFGTELKYAGFDGLVMQGKATSPCYLWVTDDTVEIRDASDLWGLGTYDTQRELQIRHGKDVRSLVIGPAGENQSRIAVLLTDNTNAAGQGGFGGVAGSKNLKAICVKGTKSVQVADPERLLKIRAEISPEATKNPAQLDADFSWDGYTWEGIPGRHYWVACTHGCHTRCMPAFKDVARRTRPGYVTQSVTCIGPWVFAWQKSGAWRDLDPVKWPLWGSEEITDFARGIEADGLIQEYGLNEWELLGGMIPWIAMASHEGLLTEEDFGFPIEIDNPEWWVKTLHMIAYREGFGDLLAEGTTRAIHTLGEEEYGRTWYTGERSFQGEDRPVRVSIQEAWGYASHWSGRGIHSTLPYPDWLLRALTWMTATRDSNDDTHHRDKAEWYEEFKQDPYRGDRGPWMAIWDEHKAELKDALTLCDWAFPLPGRTSVEAELFSAVTGMETSEGEMDKAAERLKNQCRAVLVRNHDRTREVEFNEILPYFKIPDKAGIPIDEEAFAIMVDNYYEQRGWDKETGWPTRNTLEDLDLKDVADELEGEGKLP